MNDYQPTGPVFYWPTTDEIVIYIRTYDAVYAYRSKLILYCYQCGENTERIIYERPEDHSKHGWLKLGEL